MVGKSHIEVSLPSGIYNRNHHGDIHGCLSENGVFTPIISEDIICFFWRCVCVLCKGPVNLFPSTAQRRRWFEIVISGLIIPTYLQNCFFFNRHGTAKPRTPIPILSQSPHESPILFMSFMPHGFRNLVISFYSMFWIIWTSVWSTMSRWTAFLTSFTFLQGST